MTLKSWLILVMVVLLAIGCSTQVAPTPVGDEGAAAEASAAETQASTPPPFTIEIGPFEPTLDISDFSTTICCSNCPNIPVHRVIDGDTFQSANATIRLYGVDTPERGEHCYDEATDRLRELAGDSVRVEFGPRQGDQYGRILYYVYNMDGESIDEMLVREGLALAWLEDGQHRKERRRRMREGVWAVAQRLPCLWVTATRPIQRYVFHHRRQTWLVVTSSIAGSKCCRRTPMGLIGTETELGVKVRWAGPGVVPGGILFLGNSGIPLLGDDRGSRRAYGRSGRGIRNKPPLKASLWRGRLKASTTDEGAPSQ